MAQRPKDLRSLLEQLGLEKWLAVFDREEVNLQVFLSLTDQDLKEVGIKYAHTLMLVENKTWIVYSFVH